MKDILINNIMSNILKLNRYSDSKLLEIKYGLESLYLSISKFLVIVFVSILLHIFKELILFIAAFSILKVTAFGLHTKKSWQCWITSVPIFIIIPYLIKMTTINYTIIYIFFPLFILSFYIYAPSDTEKRPIINKRKRIIYKIITLFTSVIYTMLIITIKNSYLTSILFYSMFLESLLINPISYKFFGLKYNNYLSYKKKGEKE